MPPSSEVRSRPELAVVANVNPLIFKEIKIILSSGRSDRRRYVEGHDRPLASSPWRRSIPVTAGGDGKPKINEVGEAAPD